MNRIVFLAAIALSLVFTGCKDDPEEKTSVNFSVELTNGSEIIHLHDTVQLQQEYDLYLSLFRLYLSKITLTNTSGEEVLISDIQLLSPGTDAENSFSEQIEQGTYNKLTMGFGVDPEQNNMQPEDFENEHPLSSHSSMYWSMLKYRFAKFEGRASSRVTGNDNIQVSYHPGTDAIFQQRSFDVDLGAAQSYNIKLSFDLNEIISGPGGDIDFASEPDTHSTPGDIHIARKFMENLAASAKVTSSAHMP